MLELVLQYLSIGLDRELPVFAQKYEILKSEVSWEMNGSKNNVTLITVR